MGAECRRHVRIHGVRRQEEHPAVAASGQANRIGFVALESPGFEVPGDDPASFSIHQNQVQHFAAGEEFHPTRIHLAHQSLISAQQKLLTGLTAGIESPRHLRSAERAVGQLARVFPGKGHALSDALIDDRSRYFGQAMHVRFTCAEVTAFDGVVKQAMNRVTVDRVSFSGVDSALSCDRVRAAGRLVNAEALHVVAQLTQGCGSRRSR